MQLIDRKVELVAPHRTGKLRNVEQTHTNLKAAPVTGKSTIDHVVQVLPLEDILPQMSGRSARQRRRRDDIKPPKSRQPGRNFLAQRKSQVLVVSAASRQEW